MHIYLSNTVRYCTAVNILVACKILNQYIYFWFLYIKFSLFSPLQANQSDTPSALKILTLYSVYYTKDAQAIAHESAMDDWFIPPETIPAIFFPEDPLAFCTGMTKAHLS